jgi:hypothetical protein
LFGVETGLERVVELLDTGLEARVVVSHRRELGEREIDALLRGEDAPEWSCGGSSS